MGDDEMRDGEMEMRETCAELSDEAISGYGTVVRRRHRTVVR